MPRVNKKKTPPRAAAGRNKAAKKNPYPDSTACIDLTNDDNDGVDVDVDQERRLGNIRKKMGSSSVRKRKSKKGGLKTTGLEIDDDGVIVLDSDDDDGNDGDAPIPGKEYNLVKNY